MSTASLGQAVLDLVGDATLLRQDIDKAGRDAESALGGIGSRLKKVAIPIGTALTGVVAGVGTAAVGIATGVGKLAMDALPLEGVANAFAGITGNADEALTKLRQGSLGMVRDAELMKSYNQAAQLVSKSFADDLPEAMQYLSKVSASTGEGMDYMVDSLVKGVGRMSPAILDNLGIQVQLSDATARASEMFGKEAGELTKAEQQAGMMNVVMEKLAENTSDMPDVAGTAAQGMGLLRTTLANLKDDLGIAVIPAFNGLLQAVTPLVERYAPGLIDFATGVVGGLAQMAEGVAAVAPHLEDIVGSFVALVTGDFPTFLELLSNGVYGLGEMLGIPRETLLAIIDSLADFAFEVKALIEQVLPAAQEIIATVLETIMTLWDEHGETVMDILAVLFEFVTETFENNFMYIVGLVQTIWSLITGDWEGAQAGIAKITDAFFAQLKNIVTTALNIVAGLFGLNRDEVRDGR